MATSAIDQLRHKIKYPRPQKLSDPRDDFPLILLERILATPDDKLDFSEFRELFAPGLPAGTYEEVIYFLPLAFAYFARPENKDGAYEMVRPLVWYTSDYKENLKTDGLLEIVGECFQECLQSWITTFTIVHYDKNGCYKKGWGLQYLDIVARLELLSETLYEMRDHKSFIEAAGEFVQYLGNIGSDPTKAAWFLAYTADEYARDAKTPRMFRFYYEPNLSVLLDQDRLKTAAHLVRRDPTLWNASPTYWYNTFDTLGLDDYIYLPES